jgi:hypothetical protein
MTTTATIEAGASINEYRVVTRDGCTLVFGSIPVDHLVNITKLAGDGQVMHTTLSQIAGATIAYGPADRCDALAEKLRAERLRANPQVDNLGRWLMVGERGMSSEAIVMNLRPGLAVGRRRDKLAHPHDPDDLKRCLMLLEDVPELVPDFPRMREVSPVWAALVDHWDELRATFLQEGGATWRKGPWSAPKTYARMRELIEGVQQ